MRAIPIARQHWLLSEAVIYRLEPPLIFMWDNPVRGTFCQEREIETSSCSYVTVSAVHTTFDNGMPEVMAWACDEKGEFLIREGEREGKRHKVSEVRGTVDHHEAVRNLGYEVEAPDIWDLPEIENPDLPQDDRPIEEIIAEAVEGFNRIIELCNKMSEPIGKMTKKLEEEGGEPKE